jgi:hypothetical protein
VGGTDGGGTDGDLAESCADHPSDPNAPTDRDGIDHPDDPPPPAGRDIRPPGFDGRWTSPLFR